MKSSDVGTLQPQYDHETKPIYNIEEIRGYELGKEDKQKIADLINDSFYNNQWTQEEIMEVYFEKDESINFLFRGEDGSIYGFGQCIPLEKSKTMYLSIGTVSQKLENNGIGNKLVNELLKRSNKYSKKVVRTQNPKMAEMLMKRGFKPTSPDFTLNTEIKKVAEEAMSEYLGTSVELNENSILSSEAHPCKLKPKTQPAKDETITKHLEKIIENPYGERLVLAMIDQ